MDSVPAHIIRRISACIGSNLLSFDLLGVSTENIRFEIVNTAAISTTCCNPMLKPYKQRVKEIKDMFNGLSLIKIIGGLKKLTMGFGVLIEL